MIIKPDLLTPDALVDRLPPEKRFDRLDPAVLHAIARKGGEANRRSPKRHRFTYSETHRGGVIRGAQRTMAARAARKSR